MKMGMDKWKKIYKRISLTVGIVLVGSALLYHVNAKAAESIFFVDGNSYELSDDNEFVVSGVAKDKLCYGNRNLGGLTIVGNIDARSDHNGVGAYGTLGTVTLRYSYDGSYQKKTEENWYLTSADGKSVNDIEIGKKVGKGAIVIQKSNDQNSWADVYIDTNVFNKPGKEKNLYEVTDADISQGVFLRVTVAYRMEKKTGEEKKFLKSADVTESRDFVEVYELYVCSSGNPVKFRDLTDGTPVADTVTKGFVVDQCGFNCIVSARKDQEAGRIVKSLESFTAPGVYSIEIKNNLDQLFYKTITVSEGLSLTCISPSVYECGKKGEYLAESKIDANAVHEWGSISRIKLAQKYDSRIKKSEKGEFVAYGITGDSVDLFIDLVDAKSLAEFGWEACEDSYGKKEKEMICGAWTGEMGTGAVIIQKSKNGAEWENIDQGRYANGLYTTDFYNNYGGKGDTYLYSPDGEEVLNGIFLKIVYSNFPHQKCL